MAMYGRWADGVGDVRAAGRRATGGRSLDGLVRGRGAPADEGFVFDVPEPISTTLRGPFRIQDGSQPGTGSNTTKIRHRRSGIRNFEHSET